MEHQNKSNFKVTCPFCNKETEFIGDNWCDELIDDSDTTHIDCDNCDFPMVITTHATFTFTVEPVGAEIDPNDENESSW